MPPGGYRGRGGYPPNGRGGYGPPRGGYGPPRGGYGPPGGYRGPPNDGMMGPMAAGAVGGMAAGAMMRGGRGGPPPGYAQRRSLDRGVSPAGSYGPYGRMPSPPDAAPGYGRNISSGDPPAPGYAAYNPDEARVSLPRAESPPPMSGLDTEGPVGQAVEMDATTGSPSITPGGFGQFGVRDSDGDVAGMVGLQQQRELQRHPTVMSDTSRYSSDE